MQTFLWGHLWIPFRLQIFLRTVAQIPSSLETCVIGRWKYFAKSSKVNPFLECGISVLGEDGAEEDDEEPEVEEEEFRNIEGPSMVAISIWKGVFERELGC